MDKFERIKKECFWEYNISEDFLKNVANNNDFRIKKFVFEKILLNSSRLFEDLSIFSKEDIEKIISELKTPEFNKDYFLKRKNMVEFYFLGKPLTVVELLWRKN